MPRDDHRPLGYIFPVGAPGRKLSFYPYFPRNIGEEFKTYGGSVAQPAANFSAAQVTGRASPHINFSTTFDEVEEAYQPGPAEDAYDWIKSELGYPGTKKGGQVFTLKLWEEVRTVIVWSVKLSDVWLHDNGVMRRFSADFQCEEFIPQALDPGLFKKRPGKKGSVKAKPLTDVTPEEGKVALSIINDMFSYVPLQASDPAALERGALAHIRDRINKTLAANPKLRRQALILAVSELGRGAVKAELAIRNTQASRSPPTVPSTPLVAQDVADSRARLEGYKNLGTTNPTVNVVTQVAEDLGGFVTYERTGYKQIGPLK